MYRAPSECQINLRHGGQAVVVTEVVAGLRSYDFEHQLGPTHRASWQLLEHEGGRLCLSVGAPSTEPYA